MRLPLLLLVAVASHCRPCCCPLVPDVPQHPTAIAAHCSCSPLLLAICCGGCSPWRVPLLLPNAVPVSAAHYCTCPLPGPVASDHWCCFCGSLPWPVAHPYCGGPSLLPIAAARFSVLLIAGALVVASLCRCTCHCCPSPRAVAAASASAARCCFCLCDPLDSAHCFHFLCCPLLLLPLLPVAPSAGYCVPFPFPRPVPADQCCCFRYSLLRPVAPPHCRSPSLPPIAVARRCCRPLLLPPIATASPDHGQDSLLVFPIAARLLLPIAVVSSTSHCCCLYFPLPRLVASAVLAAAPHFS